MKVRSEDDLLRLSAADRVWRLRELTLLRSQSELEELSAVKKSALRRAIVPVAYAHWEGYVKKIGTAYLEFVASRRLKLNELAPCFQSVYFSIEHSTDLRKQKRSALLPILIRLASSASDRVHIRTKDVISTQSNLSSDVLQDICENLGLDFNEYKDHTSFLDKILLARRNSIAHGEHQSVDAQELDNVVQKVDECISLFRNQIENAAVSGVYKVMQSPPPSPAGATHHPSA